MEGCEQSWAMLGSARRCVWHIVSAETWLRFLLFLLQMELRFGVLEVLEVKFGFLVLGILSRSS